MAALTGSGGIAIAIYAIASRDDAVSDSAGTTALIVGCGIGALFLVGAYMLVRAVFPPRARHLKVAVAQPEVRRGGQVDVQLEVTKRASDRLELGLVCTEYYDEETTDGKGNRSRTTKQADAYKDWRPQSPGGGPQVVRFEVPADAPYSYRGDCISYVWRVSAREPKKLRFDPASNVEITVRP
jgi:hypothetical protein